MFTEAAVGRRWAAMLRARIGFPTAERPETVETTDAVTGAVGGVIPISRAASWIPCPIALTRSTVSVIGLTNGMSRNGAG